jgi:hypothetical protein
MLYGRIDFGKMTLAALFAELSAEKSCSQSSSAQRQTAPAAKSPLE